MRSHNPHIFCSLLSQEISKKINEKEMPRAFIFPPPRGWQMRSPDQIYARILEKFTHHAFQALQIKKAGKTLNISSCVRGFREISRFLVKRKKLMGHVYYTRQITPHVVS